MEQLIAGLREKGTTILLACHDIDQMFRLADRIVVLRQGRVVGRPAPGRAAPGRRGGADLRPAGRLRRPPPADPAARAGRPAGLGGPLVQPVPDHVRARGGARHRTAVHPPGSTRARRGQSLVCAASLGLAAWSAAAVGAAAVRARPGGPVGLAAATEEPVIEADARSGAAWAAFSGLAARPRWPAPGRSRWPVPAASAASSPSSGPRRAAAPATSWNWSRCTPGTRPAPSSGTGCWTQATARNRVLETIREMLEPWPGPARWPRAWSSRLQALRRGLQADEVALLTGPGGQDPQWRGLRRAGRPRPAELAGAAQRRRSPAGRDLPGRDARPAPGDRASGSGGPVHRGRRAWRSCWPWWAAQRQGCQGRDRADGRRRALAAAGPRARGGRAGPPGNRGAAAVPVSCSGTSCPGSATSCAPPSPPSRGYASSLMQPDVTWDRDLPGAVPRLHRGRVGPARPAGRRTCSTSPPSNRACCGCSRTGATWPLVVQEAARRLPPAGAAAVAVERRPRTCPRSGPITTGWSRCLVEPHGQCRPSGHPPGTRVVGLAETAGPSRS